MKNKIYYYYKTFVSFLNITITTTTTTIISVLYNNNNNNNNTYNILIFKSLKRNVYFLKL